MTAPGAGVVARRHRRVHAELRHQAAADVLAMEVAADAELLHLQLARSSGLRRADERVVRRIVEVPDEARVGAELAREVLGIDRRVGRARVAVEPGEVAERERIGLLAGGVDAAPSLRPSRRAHELETRAEREHSQESFHFLNALSSAMLRRRTLTRGSPKKPNCRPSTRESTSARTLAESAPRARATRATCR